MLRAVSYLVSLLNLFKEESEKKGLFRLSVLDECSYCLEQSYLFNMVDMVTPQVFVRKDRKNVCIHTHTQICA